MYKLLLCWRYLRTRYIALVCIVSVMLGVATMIVVNSVMAGFGNEMKIRLNGMLGDLVVESNSLDGAYDADAAMETIRSVVGEDVVGMSPTVTVPALMYIDVRGRTLTRQIMLVGIDEATYADVGSFGDYLQHPGNREQLQFTLRDGGYDVFDHQADGDADAKPRDQMRTAGWVHRREQAAAKAAGRTAAQRMSQARADFTVAKGRAGAVNETDQPEIPGGAAAAALNNPFAAMAPEEAQGRDFDPAVETHPGMIVGLGVCSFRDPEGYDRYYAVPGDDVRVALTSASMPPKILGDFYTIVDLYESKMQEYDSSFVFVPLRRLQESRGMIDRTTGIARFSSIHVKLAPGIDAETVRDRLQAAFPVHEFTVSTWRDKQGPLLAAVQTETAVLNVLLFMIIAVAGFGILAIFFMIVVEKTRDIGILKSLGASSWGVMGIFLTYGVSLGAVGAGVGVAIGLAFTHYINEIADFIGWMTGQPVFDPAVYYFYEIPTIVHPWTVAWIALGSVVIAVAASVLPALRAANLHPVRALRYE